MNFKKVKKLVKLSIQDLKDLGIIGHNKKKKRIRKKRTQQVIKQSIYGPKSDSSGMVGNQSSSLNTEAQHLRNELLKNEVEKQTKDKDAEIEKKTKDKDAQIKFQNDTMTATKYLHDKIQNMQNTRFSEPTVEEPPDEVYSRPNTKTRFDLGADDSNGVVSGTYGSNSFKTEGIPKTPSQPVNSWLGTMFGFKPTDEPENEASNDDDVSEAGSMGSVGFTTALKGKLDSSLQNVLDDNSSTIAEANEPVYTRYSEINANPQIHTPKASPNIREQTPQVSPQIQEQSSHITPETSQSHITPLKGLAHVDDPHKNVYVAPTDLPPAEIKSRKHLSERAINLEIYKQEAIDAGVPSAYLSSGTKIGVKDKIDDYLKINELKGYYRQLNPKIDTKDMTKIMRNDALFFLKIPAIKKMRDDNKKLNEEKEKSQNYLTTQGFL